MGGMRDGDAEVTTPGRGDERTGLEL